MEELLTKEYGEKYTEFLKKLSKLTNITLEEMIDKLPSSEIIKKDELQIEQTPIARVLLGIADPASYVLTYYNITDKIPEDYPEQPKYYISKSEGSYNATFTKEEFIKSIKTKKLKR